MDVLQQISAVAFVFLLLGGVVWTLRKNRSTAVLRLPWLTRRPARTSKQLEILDRLPLTPQHALHFVRVLDATYLVATHAGGTTMVPVAEGSSFKGEFARAITKQDSAGEAKCAS